MQPFSRRDKIAALYWHSVNLQPPAREAINLSPIAGGMELGGKGGAGREGFLERALVDMQVGVRLIDQAEGKFVRNEIV